MSYAQESGAGQPGQYLGLDGKFPTIWLIVQ